MITDSFITAALLFPSTICWFFRSSMVKHVYVIELFPNSLIKLIQMKLISFQQFFPLHRQNMMAWTLTLDALLWEDFHCKLIAAMSLSCLCKISRTPEVLSPFLNESISSFTREIKQWCEIFLTNFSLSEKEAFMGKHPNANRSGKAFNKLLNIFSSVELIISTAISFISKSGINDASQRQSPKPKTWHEVLILSSA